MTARETLRADIHVDKKMNAKDENDVDTNSDRLENINGQQTSKFHWKIKISHELYIFHKL